MARSSSQVLSPTVPSGPSASQARMPSDSLAIPHGAIRTGSAGRNLRTERCLTSRSAPFWNSLSHGCYQPCSSVSSSFPVRPSLGGYLAPPGNARDLAGILSTHETAEGRRCRAWVKTASRRGIGSETAPRSTPSKKDGSMHLSQAPAGHNRLRTWSDILAVFGRERASLEGTYIFLNLSLLLD